MTVGFDLCDYCAFLDVSCNVISSLYYFSLDEATMQLCKRRDCFGLSSRYPSKMCERGPIGIVVFWTSWGTFLRGISIPLGEDCSNSALSSVH